MALNIAHLKSRLDALTGKSKKASPIWKPTPGKHYVRIVPRLDCPDNPLVELMFYYGLNKKNYLSPASVGKEDKVLEFVNKQKRTGNKDDWKLACKIEPKLRTYVPVLVRGKEADGVKWWGFGKQIAAALISLMTDTEYDDITDLSNGRDIIVEVTEEPGKQYPTITIRPAAKQSPAINKQELAHVLEKQPDLFEYYPVPTSEELVAALEAHLSPSDDPEEQSGNSVQDTSVEPAASPEPESAPVVEEKPATTPVVKPASSKSSSKDTKEMEKVFDDLFNRK